MERAARGYRALRNAGLILSLGVTCTSVAAAAKHPEPPARIVLWLFNLANVPESTLAKTREGVSHILAAAGVQVTWLVCPVGQIRNDGSPCEQDLGPDDFYVQIVRWKMPGRGENSIGFAVADTVQGGGSITAHVDYPTALKLGEKLGADVWNVLAAAAAHEIGHLLLGANAHSRRGVMSPQFDRLEIKLASEGALLYTPEQSVRIRAALAARVAAAGWAGAGSEKE
jgi:hypothetical protein